MTLKRHFTLFLMPFRVICFDDNKYLQNLLRKTI